MALQTTDLGAGRTEWTNLGLYGSPPIPWKREGGAPSALPPWHLCAVTASVALGVGTAGTSGAMRRGFS